MKNGLRRWIWCWLSVAWVLCAFHKADAQKRNPQKAAVRQDGEKEKAKRAKELFQKRKYAEALVVYQELCDAHRNAANLRLLAQCYTYAKQPLEAIKTYQALIAEFPDGKLAYTVQLIYLYSEVQNYTALLKLAEEYEAEITLEEQPSHHNFYCAMAAYNEKIKAPDDALAYYEKALASIKYGYGWLRYNTLYNMAKIHLAENQDAKAEACLRRILDDAEVPESSAVTAQNQLIPLLKKQNKLNAYAADLLNVNPADETVRSLHLLIAFCRQTERFDQMQQAYQRLIERQTEQQEKIYTQWINDLDNAKRWQEALDVCRVYSERVPQKQNLAQLRMMVLLNKLGRYEELAKILDAFDRAALATLGHEGRYLEWAQILNNIGRRQEAINLLLDRLAKMKPNAHYKKVYHQTIVDLFEKSGQPDRALRHLLEHKNDIASTTKGLEHWAITKIEALFKGLKDPAPITDYLEKRTADKPDEEALRFLARIYARTSENQKNIRVYERLLDLNPNARHDYNKLLQLLQTEKQYKRMVEVYDALFKAFPLALSYNLNPYLFAVKRAGDVNKAIELGHAYLDRFPKDGNIHTELAEFLKNEGRTREALHLYDEALTLVDNQDEKDLIRLQTATILPQLDRLDESIAITRAILTNSTSQTVKRQAHLSWIKFLKQEQAAKAKTTAKQPDPALTTTAPELTYYGAHDHILLACTTQGRTNMVARGTIKASSFEEEHAPRVIAESPATATTRYWRSLDSQGWMRVRWDAPQQVRYLILRNLAGLANSQWETSILNLDDGTRLFFGDQLGERHALTIDLGSVRPISEIEIHYLGRVQPALTSFEAYHTLNDMKATLPDPFRKDEIWYVFSKGFVLHKTPAGVRTYKGYGYNLLFDDIEVRELAFTPDYVWAATDRGAMRFDRDTLEWSEYAVNRTYLQTPIKSISATNTNDVVIVLEHNGYDKTFVCEQPAMRWRTISH